MRITKNINGIIFRTYDSKSTDKVVVVATESGQRKSFLAKGVKSKNSKKAYAIEMGNLVRISYLDGYAVPIITEISLLKELNKTFQIYSNLVLLQFIFETLNYFLDEISDNNLIYKNLQLILSFEEYQSILKSLSFFLLHLLYNNDELQSVKYTVDTGEEITEFGFTQRGVIGYVSENNSTQVSNKIPIRILKAQNFLMQKGFADAMKVSLSPSEIIKMLQLHVEWVETLLGKELKSKKLLTQELRKINQK